MFPVLCRWDSQVRLSLLSPQWGWGGFHAAPPPLLIFQVHGELA